MYSAEIAKTTKEHELGPQGCGTDQYLEPCAECYSTSGNMSFSPHIATIL